MSSDFIIKRHFFSFFGAFYKKTPAEHGVKNLQLRKKDVLGFIHMQFMFF